MVFALDVQKHEEHVGAIACSAGAAWLDLLQHGLALWVPSLLTLCCQWGRSVIGLRSWSISAGSPNICNCLNWSSCSVLPACHRSHVASVFDFFLVKKPGACSSGVMDSDWIVLIGRSVNLVEMSASSCSVSSLSCAGHECGCCNFDVALDA